jgi:hypothetical protein
MYAETGRRAFGPEYNGDKEMRYLRAQLPVLSIRNSDQLADFGVLPEPAAQDRAKICVVLMPSPHHNDMKNSADGPAKARITELVLRFLRNENCAGDA